LSREILQLSSSHSNLGFINPETILLLDVL
jgi:hypothetical protein